MLDLDDNNLNAQGAETLTLFINDQKILDGLTPIDYILETEEP